MKALPFGHLFGLLQGFSFVCWILKKTVLLLVRISWLGWVLFKREANSLGSIRWGEKLPRYLHDSIREKHGMPATSPEKPRVFVLLFWIIHSGNGCFFSGMDGSFVCKKIPKSDVKFSTEVRRVFFFWRSTPQELPCRYICWGFAKVCCSCERFQQMVAP